MKKNLLGKSIICCLLLVIGSYSALKAQTIWDSGTFTFTKTAVGQKDSLSPNTALTRGFNLQLFNIFSESGGNNGDCSWTPGNTQWAYGSIANWRTLTYMNLWNLHGCNPPSMVGQPMVLHLLAEDIYLQITFSYWQQGGGGNFTYTRTTVAPACSGAPATASVTASITSACGAFNSDISLSNDNNMYFSGITYKWQKSTNNVAYSTVSSVTNLASYANATINASIYYNCVITCTNTQDSITLPGLLLSVNPIPSITNNTCSSLTTTLTAIGGLASYTWTPANNLNTAIGATVIATPSVSTTYMVTDANGCSGSIYVTNEKPLITAQQTTICVGNTTNDTISVNDFLNKGLVAYYPFNGNANDFSGNGYNATTYGVSLTTDRFGNANKSYNFAGTSTYIACPPATYFKGGDFTISGWVNINSLGSWARMMDFGNGSASDNVLVALSVGNDNQLGSSVYLGGSGSDIESSQVIDFNKWVQVLVTLKGTTRVVYYNGVAIDSTTTSNIPANVLRNNCFIGLSNWSDGGVYGSMDDIRIYGRALNNAEVSMLYNYEAAAEAQTTYSWSNGSTNTYVAVNPTVTTTYTVTETRDGSSCNAANAVQVTVPTVNVNHTANICSGNTITLTASGLATYTWSANAGSVTTATANVNPNTTNTYTVTGTLGNCVSADTIHVNVTITPTVNVTGTTTFCSGYTTTLTASGASTYTWVYGASTATTATISAHPITPKTFTVTGANGTCTTVVSVPINVTTTPTVNINSTGNSICTGSDFTLTANGASTYTWSANVGSATSASVSLMPSGTDTYTVKGANGVCTTNKTVTVTVNPLPNLSVNNSTICAGTSATLTASGTATSYTWSTTGNMATITPTPTASITNYTVTGTDANNCVNMAVATVTVNSLPTISVNNALICYSNTATLTATGTSNTYSWSTTETSASIVVTPSASITNYTVTGTDANNCENMAVATVTLNFAPNLVFAITPNILCTTDPAVTLNANPSGGTFTGTGVSAGTFDPAVAGAGTYTITYAYTDANNCTYTDDEGVSVQVCSTGINAVSANNIGIYPNPTSNDLFIQTNTTFDNATIEVYDMIGQKVMVEKLQNNVTRVSLSNLNNAVYQIRVINNNALIYQSKIVKQQ
jgi:hypothetical protein